MIESQSASLETITEEFDTRKYKFAISQLTAIIQIILFDKICLSVTKKVQLHDLFNLH